MFSSDCIQMGSHVYKRDMNVLYEETQESHNPQSGTYILNCGTLATWNNDFKVSELLTTI